MDSMPQLQNHTETETDDAKNYYIKTSKAPSGLAPKEKRRSCIELPSGSKSIFFGTCQAYQNIREARGMQKLLEASQDLNQNMSKPSKSRGSW